MAKFILIIATPLMAVGLLIAGEAAYSPSKQRAFPESYGLNDKIEEARKKLKLQQEEFNRVEAGTAELVVESTEHDFGIMDPFSEGQHQFVVRNQGTASLKLSDGGKTCLCVGFEYSPSIVPPGGQATVKLSWNTKYPSQEYSHGGSLRTNDPDVPLLKFRVRGKVLTELGFEAEGIIFTKVWPGQPQSQEILVFSDLWEAFDVEEAQISNPKFALEWEPVPAEELPIRSLAAYRLKVTTPPDLPRGNFQEQLTLVARATRGSDEGVTKNLTLSIEGYVAKRISLFGSELNAEGLVDFGVVSASKGKTSKMFLRVNDEQTALTMTNVIVKPSFLKVDLQPQNIEKGLYTLTIEIPPYADPGTFTADTAGEIHIEFEHPRIHDLELDFHAIVLPAGN